MRKPSLIKNWRRVLSKAWSVRLATLSALFGCAETVAQQYGPTGGKLAAVGAACGAAAVVTRVLDQQINGNGASQP